MSNMHYPHQRLPSLSRMFFLFPSMPEPGNVSSDLVFWDERLGNSSSPRVQFELAL